MEKLTKVVGFGMGLEFRESAFILNAKNEALVKAGMVFNVSLGVSRFPHALPGMWKVTTQSVRLYPFATARF